MSTIRFVGILAALALTLHICDLTARLEAAEAHIVELKSIENYLGGF